MKKQQMKKQGRCASLLFHVCPTYFFPGPYTIGLGPSPCQKPPTTNTPTGAKAKTAIRSSKMASKPIGSAIIATSPTSSASICTWRPTTCWSQCEPWSSIRRRERDPLGEGQPCTWRTRLIKVAAIVRETTRRVIVELPSSWPYLHHYRQVFEQLIAGARPAFDSR